MSTGFPLLVGAGPLPELKMRQACEALARACRCPLTTVASGASPAEVLQTNPAATGLVRLSGDAARPTPQGDASWLQALADWRQPVLLLTTAEQDGSISGAAAAYAALCRELQVPCSAWCSSRAPGMAQRDAGTASAGWAGFPMNSIRNRPNASTPSPGGCNSAAPLNAGARGEGWRRRRSGARSAHRPARPGAAG